MRPGELAGADKGEGDSKEEDEEGIMRFDGESAADSEVRERFPSTDAEVEVKADRGEGMHCAGVAASEKEMSRLQLGVFLFLPP